MRNVMVRLLHIKSYYNVVRSSRYTIKIQQGQVDLSNVTLEITLFKDML